ncbi:RarD [Oceaniovalibus guishaninsula JLT2003]|uniref:RarD n=1 Tax=Oceaniovalibus guishaninsula JLT2003 TaxID=1231392 RepID=K2I3W8_9RHOB|nr:EamA family transporter RarD [Oceaniovalibus guishaninsula]EKE43550.1 RarD [Oceaniovalibus guishaninsula JLT2003]
MSPTTLQGAMAMVGCCTIWGLSPLYYKYLDFVPPLELLAHRTLWSLVFFGLIQAVRGRLHIVVQALRPGRPLVLCALAAMLISVNWFVFISAIQGGRGVEASLGYYIFPLVAVAIGRVVFGERLGPLAWLAIALACLGVTLLTVGLRAAPWVALILAISFGLYGAVKKTLLVGALASVTAEVTLLAPLALAWLWFGVQGAGAFGQGWAEAGLLIFSGPLTAVPLMLFGTASRGLTMASVGIIGYLNPTLQFICAAFIFGEVVTGWHLVAFAFIWTALALYSGAMLRRPRKRAQVAGTFDAVPPSR